MVLWPSWGSQSGSIGPKSDFDFFNNVNGSFDLEQLQIGLFTKNYLGASGELSIKKLEAKTNSNSLLLNSNLINSAFEIEAASENSDNTVNPSELEILFDEQNSNIDEVI